MHSLHAGAAVLGHMHALMAGCAQLTPVIHLAQVAEQMVQGSSPGGEFERALLLVSGDHGEHLC